MAYVLLDIFAQAMVPGDNNITKFRALQVNMHLETLVATGSVMHAIHVQPEVIALVEVLVKCHALLGITVPQVLNLLHNTHVLTVLAILILAQAM